MINDTKRHSSVYSGSEKEPAKTVSRKASVDPQLATAIFVQGHPSPAAREMLDISAPASPVKSTKSCASQILADPSMPSFGSVATSNAEAAGQVSPSTQASSVEDEAHPTIESKVITDSEKPYIHSNHSADFSFLRTDPNKTDAAAKHVKSMSVYGPDILAKAHSSGPGMNGTLLKMTAGADAEREDLSEVSGDGVRDLRASRSQSRLKGLKFWKKKPGLEIEQTP